MTHLKKTSSLRISLSVSGTWTWSQLAKETSLARKVLSVVRIHVNSGSMKIIRSSSVSLRSNSWPIAFLIRGPVRHEIPNPSTTRCLLLVAGAIPTLPLTRALLCKVSVLPR